MNKRSSYYLHYFYSDLRLFTNKQLNKDVLGLSYLQEYLRLLAGLKLQQNYMKLNDFILDLYKNEKLIFIDYNIRDFDL